MLRTYPVLLLAVFGLLPDSSFADSATAPVHVGAVLSGPEFAPAAPFVEVGLADGEPYVLSSEPDPWNYLIHADVTGSVFLAYTAQEAEPLVWHGASVWYARVRQAEEKARLAALERARKQAEAEAGAAGDLPAP